ncbi:FKBP-type peptidyl-prolyl cis-trans isomerase [Thaumasiovibrio sp. DFM-14]|uniref:FKBP-type peptidyl-prolyl cis-trans isomerase n=1 Tax=Thaumasiovibrio sp. DFM-14 TaxID=3384792 RepID=UPI0039A37989
MTNRIQSDSEVLIHFDIKLKDGSVAESTQAMGKPAKFRLGDGSLTTSFERCLLGLQCGDKASFELAPEDAFGQPNPDNIQHFSRSQFGADIEPELGNIIAFTGPDGIEIPGIVRDVEGDSVTVDFNHPLSGVDIIFDVDIVEIIA